MDKTAGTSKWERSVLAELICPACGYSALPEPPYDADGQGNDAEICESCGFHFAVDDDDVGWSFDTWRARWIAGGMEFWSKHRSPSTDAVWDPILQLMNLDDPGSPFAGPRPWFRPPPRIVKSSPAGDVVLVENVAVASGTMLCITLDARDGVEGQGVYLGVAGYIETTRTKSTGGLSWGTRHHREIMLPATAGAVVEYLVRVEVADEYGLCLYNVWGLDVDGSWRSQLPYSGMLIRPDRHNVFECTTTSPARTDLIVGIKHD